VKRQFVSEAIPICEQTHAGVTECFDWLLSLELTELMGK